MADKKTTGNTEKKTIYETQESLYKKAMAKLEADELIVQPAYKISNYKTAAAMFEEVGDYLDAPEKAAYCRNAIGEARKLEQQTKYNAAVYRMEMAETSGEWEHLARVFESLNDYEGAAEKAAYCRKQERKLERKHRRVLGGILAVAVLLAVSAGAAYYSGFYRYVKGMFFLRAGSYMESSRIFESMPGFLDSDELARKSLQKALKKTKPGSDLAFGKYKWKVLERENGTVRLIASDIGSSHIFYRVPFHRTLEEVTWENSSLREWLNAEVLEEIFTDVQRESLVPQVSGPSENTVYGTEYDGETEDYLTLLSMEEIESGRYEQCLSELGHDYWLRTPGSTMESAAYLNSDHEVRSYGVPVNDENMMVRPVILVRYE